MEGMVINHGEATRWKAHTLTEELAQIWRNYSLLMYLQQGKPTLTSV